MTNVVRFKLPEKFLASRPMGATGTYGADFENRGSRGYPADDVQRSVLPDYLPDQGGKPEIQMDRRRKRPPALLAASAGRMDRGAPRGVQEIPPRHSVVSGDRQHLDGDRESAGGSGRLGRDAGGHRSN